MKNVKTEIEKTETEVKPLMNLNGVYIFDDTKIEYVANNPKRPSGKSHARFEAYMKSKTVAEALSNGATKADLKYDFEKKLLALS